MSRISDYCIFSSGVSFLLSVSVSSVPICSMFSYPNWVPLSVPPSPQRPHYPHLIRDAEILEERFQFPRAAWLCACVSGWEDSAPSVGARVLMRFLSVRHCGGWVSSPTPKDTPPPPHKTPLPLRRWRRQGPRLPDHQSKQCTLHTTNHTWRNNLLLCKQSNVFLTSISLVYIYICWSWVAIRIELVRIRAPHFTK